MERIKHYYRGKWVDITEMLVPFPKTPECNHSDEGVCYLCNPQRWDAPNEVSGALASHLLSEKLLEAKKAYYTKGNSKLSDNQYDSMESSLRAINPDAEVLQKVGYELEGK